MKNRFMYLSCMALLSVQVLHAFGAGGRGGMQSPASRELSEALKAAQALEDLARASSGGAASGSGSSATPPIVSPRVSDDEGESTAPSFRPLTREEQLDRAYAAAQEAFVEAMEKENPFAEWSDGLPLTSQDLARLDAQKEGFEQVPASAPSAPADTAVPSVSGAAAGGGAAGSADDSDRLISPYRRMKTAGVSDGAIMQKMQRDSVSLEDQQRIIRALGLSVETASATGWTGRAKPAVKPLSMAELGQLEGLKRRDRVYKALTADEIATLQSLLERAGDTTYKIQSLTSGTQEKEEDSDWDSDSE